LSAADSEALRGERVAACQCRHQIAYDSLIVAARASQSYFGRPEFARDAPGMKTIDHALRLRGWILGAFEMRGAAMAGSKSLLPRDDSSLGSAAHSARIHAPHRGEAARNPQITRGISLAWSAAGTDF
jgi:hypothetical protein